MLPSQYGVNFLNTHYNTVLTVLEYSLILLVLSVFGIFIGFATWLVKHRKE